MPRFSSCPRTAIAPVCAIASTISTPGMTGRLGKWPERYHSSSLTALRALPLLERERDAGPVPPIEDGEPSKPHPGERARIRNPYYEWLDRPKSLSGRALAEGNGLVRVVNPEGTIRRWVERSEVEALFDAGWVLEDRA